jgi:hypothetical protein
VSQTNTDIIPLWLGLGLRNAGQGLIAAQCFVASRDLLALPRPYFSACLQQNIAICSAGCTATFLLQASSTSALTSTSKPTPTTLPCIPTLPTVCQVLNSGLLAPVLLTVNTVVCQQVLDSFILPNPAAPCFETNLLSILTSQDFGLCLTANFPLCR